MGMVVLWWRVSMVEFGGGEEKEGCRGWSGMEGREWDES